MRKSTLASVCSALALLIVLAMGFFRVKTPHNIPFFVLYLVLMPLVSVAMSFLNKRLLAWRKGRDRDHEEKLDEVAIVSARPQRESLSQKS